MVLTMVSATAFPFRHPSLEQSPFNNLPHNGPSVIPDFFLPNRGYLPSPWKYTCQYSGMENRSIHPPMRAQFLVLGILSTSHSTSQPQCTLKLASHTRYIEYELPLPPSPPRFSLSTNSPVEYVTPGGSGYGGILDRSYLASNDHAQQGMLM